MRPRVTPDPSSISLMILVHAGVLEIQLVEAVDAQADLDAVLDERVFPDRELLQPALGAVALQHGHARGVGGDAVAAGDDQLRLDRVAVRRAAEDEALACRPECSAPA